jgi:hypothetical protein
LLRNLDNGEDPSELPKDGEFHGSFSLAYFHTTSKGKQKERSKVIPENGVYIKFTKMTEEEQEEHQQQEDANGTTTTTTRTTAGITTFKVDGKGTNQFGIFHINGTAEPTLHDDDPSYKIVLRKRYEPSPTPSIPTAEMAVAAAAAAAAAEGGKKIKKRKFGSSASGGGGANDSGGEDNGDGVDEGPLPPPAQSYEKNVVCLRGKLYKEHSEDLGLGVGEVVHRITGMWSSGLDLILVDPQNVQGLCNRFEYEHKSSVPSGTIFPISGRYSGWFDLNQEDGNKTKINERDITLRFRKNNAGYNNVEGRGSNVFGKYSITGTLTLDNVITIFRHFQPRKLKALKAGAGAGAAVTSAPPPLNAPGAGRRLPSMPAFPEPKLELDEIKVPDDNGDGGGELKALKPPEHPTYSAVSRGILRLNEDGSHSCQGKWAVTREHFTNGQTSNFNFRLEAHFATEAAKNSEDRPFPLDSEFYKGSFQLKKGGSRYQTVVDQQIVMKFRKNTTGSFNVYGTGINGIGRFNLTGTLIMSGKTGGQVELYRVYPPELLATPPPKVPASAPAVEAMSKQPAVAKPAKLHSGPSSDTATLSAAAAAAASSSASERRGSTRQVKLPSRLEDDDPKAQLARIMEKCTQNLRFMREKDVEAGAFFSEPVDPVALGIPTYHQVIREPMDLRTINRKMEANEIRTPEEFARMSRLVFENAMTFNIDPTHSVHQAARNLLIIFNQKFRDIERMAQTLSRVQKGTEEDKKKGNDRKRRWDEEEVKSLKRRRLDEALQMTAANASSMAAIVAVAPTNAPNVSRNEFNLMLQMMQQLQRQIVQTYTAVAELSSDDIESGYASFQADDTSAMDIDADDSFAVPAVPEKKKLAAKKKPDERLTVAEDDLIPLTLKEQELLTDTINELHADHLHGVIQIIRDAAQLTGDEDEIDLEIDQLDTATQRKLLRHVSKVRTWKPSGLAVFS